MKVETFEDVEVASEPIEACEESLRIVEKCGLDGQKALFSKVEGTELKTRCPYRRAKKEELTVYGLICQQQTKLNEFVECPIPLRVLQVIEHAKSLEFFKCYMVWSAVSQEKEPVLFAYTDCTSWGSPQGDCYILARWGEELDEWPVLVKKAIAKWKSNWQSAIITVKTKIAADESVVNNASTLEDIMQKDKPWYNGF